MFLKSFLILAGLLQTGTANQAAPVEKSPARLDANGVVDKVQAFYVDTAHLRAKFRQTVVNKTFGRKTISDGRVYIKKPGKMRWDYYKKNKRTRKTPNTKSFISDGKTLWAVFHGNKEYYEKNIENDLLPVAITFLSGKGDLRTDFKAALDRSGKYGKKSDYVLELTPKKPSAQYKMLWLVVDSKNYRVKQSIILNTKGDTNQFRFFEPNTSKSVKDYLFAFNAKRLTDYRKVEPPK